MWKMSFGIRSIANGQRMPKLRYSQRTPGSSKHVSSHVQRVPQPKNFAHLQPRCDTRNTKPLPTACVVKVCARHVAQFVSRVRCNNAPFCVCKTNPKVVLKSAQHFARHRTAYKNASEKQQRQNLVMRIFFVSCVCVLPSTRFKKQS